LGYAPFKVQRAAHRAILVDGYRRGMLFWSRRCLAKGTKIATENGTKPIEQITTGDRVWASNGYQSTLTAVTDTHKYGVDLEPKPMIDCVVNGHRLKATYDHEIHVGDDWFPIYIVAWRAMAASDRLQLKLLCEQYGTALDDEEIRRELNRFDVSGDRRVWLLADGDERTHDKGPQSSSADMAQEPSEQATSEPHRQQPPEQPSRQSRMGDESRESGAHDETRTPKQKLRREVGQSQNNRDTSKRDFTVSVRQSDYEQIGDVKTIGRTLPVEVGEYPAHFKRQDMEIHQVSVHAAEETYDLTTEHHNYVANGVNVHNTGKTLWSVQQLMMSCFLNQGPHHIVFKEYQQAETVAWNQYIHMIPEGLIKDKNKSTLTVTFNYFNGKVQLPINNGSCRVIDGELMHSETDCDCIVVVADYSKPSASIRLLGSDKADSHRGGESYGMIFDEYQDQDHYGWDFVYRQFLYTTAGWAIFMGTAKSDDSWIEMLENAEKSYEESQDPNRPREFGDWYYSKATWRENPLIKPEVIEADRKQAMLEGKMGAFLQETELVPFSQQGAVYPMFNKKIHVIKPEDVPDEGTDYIALDFGFAEGHPMAACFIRITRDDVWYQWDEIHGTGVQIDDLCAEIRTKMGDRLLTGVVADSARPDLIEYMQSRGFPVIPSPKKQNSIVSGIALLSKRLRPKIQIIGEPKPNYFVTNNCKGTIYDWTHYRYKEVKQDRPPQELPEKRYDDAPDAIRYLELFFKFGQVKNEKPMQSSLLKEMNSYGTL
jgi:hypothetical protein